MKQLEQFYNKEFLQKFDPADYLKREIIDQKTGKITAIRYYNEGINFSMTYVEPNIEEFKALINMSAVIEPLTWLTKIESVVGVEYKKYLYVKAIHSKLKRNNKNINRVMELWEMFGE